MLVEPGGGGPAGSPPELRADRRPAPGVPEGQTGLPVIAVERQAGLTVTCLERSGTASALASCGECAFCLRGVSEMPEDVFILQEEYHA